MVYVKVTYGIIGKRVLGLGFGGEPTTKPANHLIEQLIKKHLPKKVKEAEVSR